MTKIATAAVPVLTLKCYHLSVVRARLIPQLPSVSSLAPHLRQFSPSEGGAVVMGYQPLPIETIIADLAAAVAAPRMRCNLHFDLIDPAPDARELLLAWANASWESPEAPESIRHLDIQDRSGVRHFAAMRRGMVSLYGKDSIRFEAYADYDSVL